jgi:hypothetical protein
LTDFGIDRDTLEVLVDSGNRFRPRMPRHDDEIPACNRPYGGGYSLIPVCAQCPDVALVRRQIQRDDVNSYDEEASK